MCCRRSFGVSTWSIGIALDVPALTPRRRHPGHLSRVALLELANPRFELACQPDLVPAGAQHLLAERVDVEAVARPVGRRHLLRLEVHAEHRARSVVELTAEAGDDLGRQDHRQEAVLEAILVKNVPQARRDHRADAIGVEHPDRHLARGAAAEVLGHDEDLRVTVGRLIQDELGPLRAVGVEANVVEEEARVPRRAPGLSQEARGNDAVRVDVGQIERRRDRGEVRKGLQSTFRFPSPRRLTRRSHQNVLTSVNRPETAAAAAIAGDIRCVRAPLPWRPSKLRLEVEATRSPSRAVSPFIPTHIEQPASRHSKPASTKTRSSPSASAARLTSPEPGTIHAGTMARRPFTTRAAARRSSSRLLVQEPMKTRSTLISVSGVPALSPMYARARSMLSRRAASPATAGSGTRPVMGRASCGLVPQVTVGAIALAASSTSRSNGAPGSLGSGLQEASASPHASPRGAKGRPSRYAKVVSSGATMPARAPASIDMLQTVMRSSMDMARIVEPAYSIACPTPPPALISAMIARITSLAVTPAASRPSTVMRMTLGVFCQSVCVAITCSTSVEPMPKASAPNAP